MTFFALFDPQNLPRFFADPLDDTTFNRLAFLPDLLTLSHYYGTIMITGFV